jgi:hypothetical protein
MMLDVFRSDAFHFTKLVAAINKLPFQPTMLGDMGLFAEEGIPTLTVGIEMQGGKLTLVQSQARGSRGKAKNLERREMRDFRPVHLPQSCSVMADEVRGLRAFGSETDEELAMRHLMKKMAVCRRDLDYTHEYQRMGALKGLVLDADGSTIYDFFNEFGVTKTTHTITLSAAATKVLQEVVAAKRKAEDALGAASVQRYIALCSSGFFDALTGNAAFLDAYKRQNSEFMRQDQRRGFEYADVTWIEYRGAVGQAFIPANKALMIPVGVPDLFATYWAPADYEWATGTTGLPFYTSPEDLPHKKGIEYDVQSNPLHMCTRPDAIVELTAN